MAKKEKKPIPVRAKPNIWVVEAIDDQGRYHARDDAPTDYNGAVAFARGMRIGMMLPKDSDEIRVVHSTVPVGDIAQAYIEDLSSRLSDGDGAITYHDGEDIKLAHDGGIHVPMWAFLTGDQVQRLTGMTLLRRQMEED